MRFPVAPSDEFMHVNLATDDGVIRLVLTFDGHVDASRMGRAAELTLADEPLLCCRFVEGIWRSYWEWQDSPVTVFRLIDDSGEGTAGLDRFMAEPASPGRSPQVQALLYRAVRDVLCIRISHLVADGIGALDYVGRLARIYRQLEADAAYLPQPNLSVSRHPAQILRHVSPSKLGRVFGRRPVPRGLARWGLPPGPGRAPHAPPVFLTRRIASDQLAGLVCRARSREITLTGLLLAGFFRALFEVLDPPAGIPLPVAVPMNLRRYLPSGHARRISNLTGALLPVVSREPGADFEKTLVQVQAAMKAARESQLELAQVLYGSLALLPGVGIMRRLARRFQVACPSFSNLGVIDADIVDFGGPAVCDVSIFGPVQYPPAFGLLVNTFGRTTTITTGTFNEAVAHRFLDRFLSELPS
jgi:NRPS condensation-like uncharacterized protein